jgi:hypothetical protein
MVQTPAYKKHLTQLLMPPAGAGGYFKPCLFVGVDLNNSPAAAGGISLNLGRNALLGWTEPSPGCRRGHSYVDAVSVICHGTGFFSLPLTVGGIPRCKCQPRRKSKVQATRRHHGESHAFGSRQESVYFELVYGHRDQIGFIFLVRLTVVQHNLNPGWRRLPLRHAKP